MVEIHRRENQIDSLFNKVNLLITDENYDIELVSEFTKYLCVLVSGHLEKSIYLCLTKYSFSRSSSEVAKYVDQNLKRFTNAKIGKVEALLENYSKDWKDEIQKLNNYDEIKGSINSLITDRHAIAHGNTLSLSKSKLEKYYKDTKIFLREIERITA